MRQKIGFIIICYYTPLLRFRRLIRAMGRRSIVVIDNAENEDQRIQNLSNKRGYKYPPNVLFLTGSENLGYATSVNIGLKYLFKSDIDWAIIVNDDIRCTKKSVDTFCKSLANKTPGVVGIYPGFIEPNRFSTFTQGKNFLDNLENHKQIDYVSGSFWAIHKDVCLICGDLFEPYFMYYEEVDYCLKVKKYGFPVFLMKKNGIYHDETSVSSKSTYFHDYYLARNHLLFIERNAPFQIKLRELLRLPKTYWQHYSREEEGALAGIKDYIFRRFGNAKKHI
jgi:GT2 family glycosyltransferase